MLARYIVRCVNQYTIHQHFVVADEFNDGVCVSVHCRWIDAFHSAERLNDIERIGGNLGNRKDEYANTAGSAILPLNTSDVRNRVVDIPALADPSTFIDQRPESDQQD
ncbi:hypothetical protein F0A16_07790 [Salinicola corii]|uniref:Uncharacterized protein n=1 Tax=Salinicola corii TaxID=2606937 RepID=A0A640WG22_9GAMM|nr:hypothetical protein [Salinicola corii]KAA0019228.1 hypothetical protein F0A16_07790 [Salinicola corii]